MTIEQLRAPVLPAFERYAEQYRQATTSDVPLLCEVEQYLAMQPGKQLRPLLLLLSAEATGGVTDKHILLATAMELLHNASLMHDDVVDESSTRRGRDSVRHHWGNSVAVLCGDYYLAQTMALMQKASMTGATEIIVDTVSTMSVGELKQMALVGHGGVGEEQYIDIIGCKTASLMAACCQLGAMRGDKVADSTVSHALHEFGYHYGLVFQMIDDTCGSNSVHDILLVEGIDTGRLIDQHTAIALKAIGKLPDSKAQQALLALLMPSAPKPE